MAATNQKSMKQFFFCKVPKSSLATHNPSNLEEDVVPKSNLATNNQSNLEEDANQSEVPLHSSQKQQINLETLNSDPAERTQILDYHPNLRDVIRRAYIQRGACQPREHNFPQTIFYGVMRHFNPKWFVDYHGWLEYSISNDVTYCLSCYLFKDDNIHQGGDDAFLSIGFKSWNKKKSFDKHVGGPSSFHNQAKRKCVDLLRQQQSIIYAFEKQSDQVKHDYWIRLTVSVNVVRFFLKQEFAFRGHDKSKTSFNRGNFLKFSHGMQKNVIKFMIMY
uniref:TTF-type domain-containing protein n=1 Tax=Nicotiana tabacum TaxID=4097 RepID=A0A1S4CNR5_TOBAC|nr:PREDICTED: uncharacterized protein LOC107821021 [Nicotiana tabacum]